MKTKLKTKSNYPRFVGLNKIDRWNAIPKLQSNGWRQIGSGAFATILENSSYKNMVLKVYSDRAYNHYVNEIKRSKNPHVPKIYKKYKLRGGVKAGMVLIEKLEQNRSGSNIVANMLSDYMFPWDKNKKEKAKKQLMKKYPDMKILADRLKRMISKHRCGADLHSGNILWRKKIPVITDPVC